MKTVKVILTQAVVLDGKPTPPSDTVHEVDANLATQMINNGSAKLAPEDPEPAPAPQQKPKDGAK